MRQQSFIKVERPRGTPAFLVARLRKRRPSNCSPIFRESTALASTCLLVRATSRDTSTSEPRDDGTLTSEAATRLRTTDTPECSTQIITSPAPPPTCYPKVPRHPLVPITSAQQPHKLKSKRFRHRLPFHARSSDEESMPRQLSVREEEEKKGSRDDAGWTLYAVRGIVERRKSRTRWKGDRG
ncbi:hypothetical protein BT96DRAFT_1014461 [Gymnopus androsaceus JB14]|uniref:Uncharacterized protein n=1 Tax=Gymnopus androsaceus JB14 TaxID=1447944 RepID=A0A6A4I8M9_9AGAR|nr:hypothetical protein BT96DRAFT_1014461 [Gymnopus androsaceus JB14]